MIDNLKTGNKKGIVDLKRGYKICIVSFVIALIALSGMGDLNTKVNKTGDNMTGELNMSDNNISDIHILSVDGITMFNQTPQIVYHVNNNISNSTRPYVLNLTLSNASGVNTDTTVYGNGHFDSTFSNINFYINNISQPYCIPLKATGRTYVNLTINGTLSLRYGYQSSQNSENCTATGYQYRGNETTNYLNLSTLPLTNFAYESSYRVLSSPHDIVFGVADTNNFADDGIFFDDFSTGSFLRLYTYKNGVGGFTNDGNNVSPGADHRMKITFDGIRAQYYVDDLFKNERTTNIPDSRLGLWFLQNAGTANMKYAIAIPYTVPQPAFVAWSSEESMSVGSSQTFCIKVTSTGILYTTPGACT